LPFDECGVCGVGGFLGGFQTFAAFRFIWGSVGLTLAVHYCCHQEMQMGEGF